MALAPRKSPVTREHVFRWIRAWKNASNLPTFTMTLEDYIAQQLSGLNLPDDQVNTTEHEDLDDETPLLKMILMDLESYKK